MIRETKPIISIESFMRLVCQIAISWHHSSKPIWFRGQPVDEPLLPKLYRDNYNENGLLQFFRLKARSMGITPSREHIDEWLFLMQHHGLPTRLLDWTEGALIALFFAVNPSSTIEQPIVWMLNASELNRPLLGAPVFPLSWAGSGRKGLEYFQAVFEDRDCKYDLPMAVYPACIHERLRVQKSCLTIHGRLKLAIEEILETRGYSELLVKIPVEKKSIERIQAQLQIAGISYSTLFPDFDGLAKELDWSCQIEPLSPKDRL